MLTRLFQLIDVFGGLLDRELIKKDFEPKLPDIVEKFHEELDRAKTVYDEQMKMVRQANLFEFDFKIMLCFFVSFYTRKKSKA